MPEVRPATRRDLILGASLAAAAAGVARAQSAQPKAQAKTGPSPAARADAAARALFAANPTPALSIAVARPSGVIWTGVYGRVDLENNLATTPAYRFRLGSVSKVLTSVTAAKLISRGVINLNTPISTWMPDLPAAHRGTTLKQLFTHRGGVRHYAAKDADQFSPTGLLDMRGYPTTKSILEVFINDPLVGPVGAQVFYSTFGFTLASLVMEAAAKQPFQQLVKSQIGEGFGLPSLDDDDPFALRPLRAHGYNDSAPFRAGDPFIAPGWANTRATNPAYKWAGGGFIMTPSDLARFGAAMIASPTSKITAAERSLLFTPLTEKLPSMPPLGLAWRIEPDAKNRMRWHHAGAQEGGRASLVVYPDLGLSVALASNVAQTPGDVLTPSGAIVEAFV